MKHRLFVLFTTLALLALSTGFAVAGTESDTTSEMAYYNGQLYKIQLPSSNSSNPNQFNFGCYTLGPDFTDSPAEPTGTMYAIVAEGATLDSCPDGSNKHDHIISAVPGTPGYTPLWKVQLVVEGPNFDPDIMPVTSEQELVAAVNAGQLVMGNLPITIIFNAPVIGVVK